MEFRNKRLSGMPSTIPKAFTEPTNKVDVNISSGSPEGQQDPNCPEPIPCEYCGALRFTRGIRLFNKIMWSPGGPERCGCAEAVAAYERETAARVSREAAEAKEKADTEMRERIRKNIGSSGMTARTRQNTFESFSITKDNRGAHTACAEFAQSFEKMLPRRGKPEPKRNGLLIMGPPGTGKTHLAFAIANILLAQGTPVIGMTAIELLGKIKRTFSSAGGGVDEDEVLRTYSTVPLLVIDDLGKERSTEWTASTIYSIIDRRYNALLPVIVTTNYGEKELIDRLTPVGSTDRTTAAATLDRLSEMCKAVAVVGPSWRKK